MEESFEKNKFLNMRLDDIRIVKEIHFEYEWNSKLCFAKIVYLRSLNESYSICNDNLRDIHLFQLGVYEDKYPCDELDIIILNAVKNKYKNVNVTSWLLMLDTQLEPIGSIEKMASETMTLLIGPDITSLSFWRRISFNIASVIRLPVDVYIYKPSTKSILTNDVFYAYHSIEEWKTIHHRILYLIQNTYFRLHQL